MHGFQLTFITLQDRRHHGKPLYQWLLEEAERIGITGTTQLAASAGLGHDHRLHSAHFFELADQPTEIIMAASEQQAEQLFARIHAEDIHIFYIKAPIEFGTTGENN